MRPFLTPYTHHPPQPPRKHLVFRAKVRCGALGRIPLRRSVPEMEVDVGKVAERADERRLWIHRIPEGHVLREMSVKPVGVDVACDDEDGRPRRIGIEPERTERRLPVLIRRTCGGREKRRTRRGNRSFDKQPARCLHKRHRPFFMDGLLQPGCADEAESDYITPGYVRGHFEAMRRSGKTRIVVVGAASKNTGRQIPIRGYSLSRQVCL